MRILSRILLCTAFATFGLTSCQTTSTHQFGTTAAAWQTRSAQLSYSSPRISLIGEVLLRFTKSGDFELTFTKGPGVALMTLRTDSAFGEAQGPLARGHWAGPISAAPQRLRGWLMLRDKILAGSPGAAVRVSLAGETFNLRF